MVQAQRLLGAVIVYYLFGMGNKVYWSDIYRLHWVNDQCYFHTRHRSRCHVWSKNGVY